MSKTIGILGGMGPESTVYLFNLIVTLTRVEKDQDHIPVIIYNNPKTPDRTAAIIAGGESPLPALINGAVFLEKAGADFILMPCVTAHYFYNEIVRHIDIPFLHLIEETLAYTIRELKDIKKIGLLASAGTIRSRLFQDMFHARGFEIVVPGEEKQRLLMKALYQEEGVKAGYKEKPREAILRVLDHLLRQGIEAVIAGCTEIPLVLNQSHTKVPFIDPMEIVARESIRRASI